jgi:hypothetical protein
VTLGLTSSSETFASESDLTLGIFS